MANGRPLIHRHWPSTPLARSVVTIGNFDGLHLGHQAMLRLLREQARLQQAALVVVTFEPHPRELFSPGTAPARLLNLREKMEHLQDQGVDHVVVLRFNRRLAALSASGFVAALHAALRPVRVLVGDDFCFGAQRQGNIDTLRALGAELGFSADALPSVTLGKERISSTAVRDALARGDLAHAEALLGRPYRISGRVMHGLKLGRQLGFPTANIQCRRNRLPLTGIYVVAAHDDQGRCLPGVASLGWRPTIASDLQPTLEVHLLDFEGDLYEQHLRIDFLHKIRDEAKFASLPELVEAIGADVAVARAHFAAQSARP